MYFCICLHPYYLFYLFMLNGFKLSLLLYYNISVACIERSLHKITTQQYQQQLRVCTIYLLMVYFSFCSAFPFFVYFMIWFFSYNFFCLGLLLLNKSSLQYFENKTRHYQQHQQKIGTIDMMFVLHCINCSFFKIFRLTFCSNILLLMSALNLQIFILIYIS